MFSHSQVVHVTDAEEDEGLDRVLHGEEAYTSMLSNENALVTAQGGGGVFKDVEGKPVRRVSSISVAIVETATNRAQAMMAGNQWAR